MKPEFKLEGDILKISLKHEVIVDKDSDGVASVKGNIGAELELDGSEVMEELLKSGDLVAKVKAKLGL